MLFFKQDEHVVILIPCRAALACCQFETANRCRSKLASRFLLCSRSAFNFSSRVTEIWRFDCLADVASAKTHLKALSITWFVGFLVVLVCHSACLSPRKPADHVRVPPSIVKAWRSLRSLTLGSLYQYFVLIYQNDEMISQSQVTAPPLFFARKMHLLCCQKQAVPIRYCEPSVARSNVSSRIKIVWQQDRFSEPRSGLLRINYRYV